MCYEKHYTEIHLSIPLVLLYAVSHHTAMRQQGLVENILYNTGSDISPHFPMKPCQGPMIREMTLIVLIFGTAPIRFT